MSMAARTAGVYIQMRGIAASAHPAAALQRGATAPRAMSRSSRRQDIGQDRGLVDRSRPGPEVPGRGGARAPRGVAVTKIFTSASGQITVPMSRPSSTAPGGVAAKSRWNSSSAARTSGIAETIEAASPTSWRLSAVSSKRAGSSALRGGDRARRGRRADGRRRAAPSPPRDRAARCRDGASRNARRAACRACPCRRRPARRWR